MVERQSQKLKVRIQPKNNFLRKFSKEKKSFYSFCTYYNYQRWSRGHMARGQGQGHKKYPRPRPRTAFPRTDTLEAKDRNARGQGQGPRTQVQVLSKEKGLHKSFLGDLKKKKIFTKIFQAISTKKRFPKKFFKRSTKF